MRARLSGFLKRYARPLGFAGILAVIAILFVAGSNFSVLGAGAPAALPANQHYAEAAELAGKQLSFQEYSTYFQHLADKKGAVYAFGVLSQTSFPPGIDLHLLGHVVGDMLYKQQGINGIKYCTQDFRNACSHSIVIGVLNDKGPSALPEIAATCKKAPGGPGAYTMCFHGLGHGVLAYTGYDLKKAVQMCALVGTPQYQDREHVECVGGTIMEMIAGVHDRAAWQKQAGNYFTKADPLSPCDAPWMPGEVRSICYIQLTPHLFEAAGGDLGNLQPSVYPKAFSFCARLPAQGASADGTWREACFGGFGKEFTVLAQGRDIRNIGDTPQPALANVRDWCALAHDAKGELACDASALASLFWGGENKPDASFTFCSLLSGDGQRACYVQLSSNISYYHAQDGQAAALCARLPEAYQAACKAGPPRS